MDASTYLVVGVLLFSVTMHAILDARLRKEIRSGIARIERKIDAK